MELNNKKPTSIFWSWNADSMNANGQMIVFRLSARSFGLAGRFVSSLSPLESFLLLVEDRGLLQRVIDYWDPQSILRIGQCNTRLHGVAKLYLSDTWNPCDLINRYFGREMELLALLETYNAILFGPVILQFFDRRLDDTSILDICVGFGGALCFETFLHHEGYCFVPTPSGPVRFGDAVIKTLAAFPVSKLVVNGERNSNELDNDSKIFTFDRNDPQNSNRKKIRLHITRGDPLRHLLSLHSCKS